MTTFPGSVVSLKNNYAYLLITTPVLSYPPGGYCKSCTAFLDNFLEKLSIHISADVVDRQSEDFCEDNKIKIVSEFASSSKKRS